MGRELNGVYLICVSARKDYRFLEQLCSHLRGLTTIEPEFVLISEMTTSALNTRIQNAALIVLLISANLLGELKQSTLRLLEEKIQKKTALILPVYTQTCLFPGRYATLTRLDWLPSKRNPIESPQNHQAWTYVAAGISCAADVLHSYMLLDPNIFPALPPMMKDRPRTVRSPPHGARIRSEFAKLFAMDEDFEAFCIDYFPEVARQFSSGMSRPRKENILLQRVPLEHIEASLSVFRRRYSDLDID